jgi:anti-sigma B factor antagonist
MPRVIRFVSHQEEKTMVNVTSEMKGNVAVIGVSGRVDGFSAPQLDDALQGAIKGKHNKIVVDLGGTEFMSSAGMRALLKARLEVQDKHGELRLAAPSDYLLDSLKLVGLDKLFHIYPSRETALAEF